MENEKPLELIGSTLCPYVHRVHITLIEKNLPYKFTAIDLSQKPEWLKTISPYEKVPVLKHGEAHLYESAIINEYLNAVFPLPSLMPPDPLLQAKIRIWIHFLDNQFIVNFIKLLLSQEKADQYRYYEKLRENLYTIEQECLTTLSGEGPYCLGKEITLLDIAMLPFFERFPVLAHYRDVTLPMDCHRLKTWMTTMQKRSSVMETTQPLEKYIQVFAKYADNSVNSISANEIRQK